MSGGKLIHFRPWRSGADGSARLILKEIPSRKTTWLKTKSLFFFFPFRSRTEIQTAMKGS